MKDVELPSNPFAHLKQHAGQRANRTLERLRAGIATLQAAGQKVTAEAIKQATRDLEPGFAGMSFQVIRRNPRAYALYREPATTFTAAATSENKLRGRRQPRPRRGSGRMRRSSYDPLQRLDKRDLVGRIRTLERDLETELPRLAALAYDQQALRSRMLRLETEIILNQAERIPD